MKTEHILYGVAALGLVALFATAAKASYPIVNPVDVRWYDE